jgi:hypothetical protein
VFGPCRTLTKRLSEVTLKCEVTDEARTAEALCDTHCLVRVFLISQTPDILWNAEFHWRIHCGSQLVYTLCHISQSTPFHRSFIMHFNIIISSMPMYFTLSRSFRFSYQGFVCIAFFPVLATCPVHIIITCHCNYVLWAACHEAVYYAVFSSRLPLCMIGRAMAQAVSRRPGTRLRSQVSLRGISDGQGGIGQVFFAVLLFYPLGVSPPTLHTHSCNYHRR